MIVTPVLIALMPYLTITAIKIIKNMVVVDDGVPFQENKMNKIKQAIAFVKANAKTIGIGSICVSIAILFVLSLARCG